MGSLPNLNELSAGYIDVDVQNDLFARAFKEKGIIVDWNKKKDHKPVYQTRSLSANPNSCVSNVPFQKKSSYDVSNLDIHLTVESMEKEKSVFNRHLTVEKYA